MKKCMYSNYYVIQYQSIYIYNIHIDLHSSFLFSSSWPRHHSLKRAISQSTGRPWWPPPWLHSCFTGETEVETFSRSNYHSDSWGQVVWSLKGQYGGSVRTKQFYPSDCPFQFQAPWQTFSEGRIVKSSLDPQSIQIRNATSCYIITSIRLHLQRLCQSQIAEQCKTKSPTMNCPLSAMLS